MCSYLVLLIELITTEINEENKVNHEVDGLLRAKSHCQACTCGKTEYAEDRTLEEMPQQNKADSMLKPNLLQQYKIKFLGIVSTKNNKNLY